MNSSNMSAAGGSSSSNNNRYAMAQQRGLETSTPSSISGIFQRNETVRNVEGLCEIEEEENVVADSEIGHGGQRRQQGRRLEGRRPEGRSEGRLEGRSSGETSRDSRISSHRISDRISQSLSVTMLSAGLARVRQRHSSSEGGQQSVMLAVRATLVDNGEVIEAEAFRYWNRKRIILAGTFCVSVVAAVLLAVAYGLLEQNHAAADAAAVGDNGEMPSVSPSLPPSWDGRPMLESVRSRGYVRCGVGALEGFHAVNPTTGEEEGISLDICRALSAVIFGDSSRTMSVPVTFADRFLQLQDRTVDVLLAGDTHTLEREVQEVSSLSPLSFVHIHLPHYSLYLPSLHTPKRTSGTGLTFSIPYYYDGVVYSGNGSYVKCAYEKKRFAECSNLSVCTIRGTTTDAVVTSMMPLSFIQFVHSFEEAVQSFFNGTCNVIISERSLVLIPQIRTAYRNGQFVLGNVTFTKEPLAAVTRKDDLHWSDIVNWVIHALIYGEEHGLQHDPILCQTHAQSYSWTNHLDFLSAVHCVGNYGQIFQRNFAGIQRGMNDINKGTGMLYATPFGDTQSRNAEGPTKDSLFGKVIQRGKLRCGVFVPHHVTGGNNNNNNNNNNGTEQETWTAMDVRYCHTLSAAIFQGNSNAVEIFHIEESDGALINALENRVDVVAGGKVHIQSDLQTSSSNGLTFSTPYYYDTIDGTNNVYALVTTENDTLFSSFVNAVVVATLYADENSISFDPEIITEEIPLVSIFGPDLRWALKDAVFHSGSYTDIYTRNPRSTYQDNDDRGRNQLNLVGEPQLLSFPGF